jgi:hypothetical protein
MNSLGEGSVRQLGQRVQLLVYAPPSTLGNAREGFVPGDMNYWSMREFGQSEGHRWQILFLDFLTLQQAAAQGDPSQVYPAILLLLTYKRQLT